MCACACVSLSTNTRELKYQVQSSLIYVEETDLHIRFCGGIEHDNTI